jgi:hypothetical protein
MNVDLTASIFDLERRIALLEQKQYGHAAPQAGAALLTRCYVEAHRLVRDIDPKMAGVWVAQAYLWDVRALVALGRAVNDPYPYRPFLAVLDRCVLSGVPGAEAALAHLEEVSQQLLVAQGLELVRPRDTMVNLRLEEALLRLGRL